MIEQGGDVGVHPDGAKPFGGAGFGRLVDHFALDLVGGNGHLGDLVFFQQLQKLAVGDDRDFRDRYDGLLQQQHQPNTQKGVPKGKFVLFLHFIPPRRSAFAAGCRNPRGLAAACNPAGGWAGSGRIWLADSPPQGR